MSILPHDPNKIRCPWCMGFEQYVKYHDEEWGVPVFDDKVHFEFLILESAQAGLSWATILKKREGYRKAFADFDYKIVADMPESYVTELLQDPSIIRNKLKIEAAINNAKQFMEIQSEFGSFSNYIWDFVDGKVIDRQLDSLQNAPATTAESDKLSKDLKKRGFKFLGSTTIYAHMQATGLVNDHLVDCFRYEEVRRLAI
ncbi:DNA-3-methyladenine glycosylase I [Belliella sp. R4-6]|uniref:DNA-3-methyladenine glycosylase I n=1 Tax=Belliella alkalica TaxID=1730871 RepID=A0ABS9V985_9BACT|nr:DNA-3-methyladenine glycosylase I [Belliella alkalica]MCH7412976.1 DNA-3-methyladenine glycosylase I [Belliella alkalica]